MQHGERSLLFSLSRVITASSALQLYVEANFIENGNKNQNSKLDVFSFTANDHQMASI
jgi:hypothetical protein